MKRPLRTLFAVMGAIAVRLLVGRGPFSGKGTLGKGGDFEAQRHWMEIAVNTPVGEWYTETPSNQLDWWGLDYPPLSGYWAWATGQVAGWINPAWVRLGESRRQEGAGIKMFMRMTVILADLLILFPSLLLFTHNRSYTTRMLASSLTTPALLLTDHGHFQYNTIMLGLVVLAVVLVLDYRRPVVGTVAVCWAVGFKQMGLYVVPAFAAFLLRQCIRGRIVNGFRLFVSLAVASLGSTALYLLPYLSSPPTSLLPLLTRIFPLHRGLYEDKVANFWCSLSILTKFDRSGDWSQDRLVRLCAGVLLAALAPSLISLLVSKPSGNRFLYALAYSSLAFYLFSYHVHEKSILVPQMAVLLLTHLSPIFSLWFSCLSALSLFQLMEKDGLEYYYLAVITGWLLYSRHIYRHIRFKWTWTILLLPTILAMYLLPIAQLTLTPPPRYPHIFHVLAMLGCSASFLLALAYLLYKQFTCEAHYYYTRSSNISVSK